VSEDEGKKICAGSFGFLQAVHTVCAIFHSFPTSPIRNQFYLVAGGLVCREASLDKLLERFGKIEELQMFYNGDTQ